MTEMIERVARAICAAKGEDPDHLEPGNCVGEWEGVDGVLCNGDVAHFFWRERANVARAAIEAMLEPTQAMRDAMNDDIDWDGDAVRAYVTGIDAALEEKS